MEGNIEALKIFGKKGISVDRGRERSGPGVKRAVIHIYLTSL